MATSMTNTDAHSLLSVDPEPRFQLPSYRFMQFMEPLGTTDSSIEAGWDFEHNHWREDPVAITQELAPTLIRWPGGILSSYYRWKEAVGPREQRDPLLNVCWGGMETNQIGTHEFIDFCQQVGADSLIAVNFESDGNRRWSHQANLQIKGCKVVRGQAFEIAADPMVEIDQSVPSIFDPVERILVNPTSCEFPAASVMAIELQVVELDETSSEG